MKIAVIAVARWRSSYDHHLHRRPQRLCAAPPGRSTPPARSTDGAVRLRIDRFALTSNNITYGAFGEGMSYWSFFPTGDAGPAASRCGASPP